MGGSPWTEDEINALLDMGSDPDYAINGGNNADWGRIAKELCARFGTKRTAHACQTQFYKSNK